ncbi:succinate dehydrogenase assembly factor 2 [Pararhodobacter oceanensis]|uniref:FAD assembly factor SdhE n=1 Tax=Pararhodobacter oceanensis TaxID=2172121 RepID=A0A2T8HX98_9RHOB|nr:succinate dehydrogenase assembly factor 2 [Pararhodobacter oceanensis]PVH30055.1 succinate dehydrogenase assembly factor 2 [Pararhodobacter oceanensis]
MTDEARLKRMKMRSWRRGIKEMDLILGPWADEALAAQDAATLDLYDALLSENDHDLYQWVTARIGTNSAQPVGPAAYGGLLDVIAAHAANRIMPKAV